MRLAALAPLCMAVLWAGSAPAVELSAGHLAEMCADKDDAGHCIYYLRGFLDGTSCGAFVNGREASVRFRAYMQFNGAMRDEPARVVVSRFASSKFADLKCGSQAPS